MKKDQNDDILYDSELITIAVAGAFVSDEELQEPDPNGETAKPRGLALDNE